MKNPFAINEKNEITYIKNLNLDCKKDKFICSECGKELIPKMGEINTWHFAHKIKSNCAGGIQTSLHKYAKELIRRSNYVVLPDLSIYEYCNYNFDKINYIDKINAYIEKDRDNIYYLNKSLINRNKYLYTWISNEKKIENFIPDCLVEVKGKALAIEILVTHEVDNIKKEKVKNANIDMIEIDLSYFEEDYKLEQEFNLDEYILEKTDRSWIYKTYINNTDDKIKSLIYNQGNCLIDKRYTTKETLRRLDDIKRTELIDLEKQKRLEIIETKKDEKRKYVEEHKNQYKLKNLEKIIKIVKYQSEYNNNEYSVCNMFIRGEYSFRGDRKIWQEKIFNTFIKNRKGKVIQLAKVNSWVEKYSNLKYYKEFDFEEGFINKYNAIKDYLQFLLNIGCLENISNYNKEVTYYMMLEVKEDKKEELNKRIDIYFKDMEEYKCKLCGHAYIKDNLIDLFYIKHFGLDEICFDMEVNKKIKHI